MFFFFFEKFNKNTELNNTTLAEIDSVQLVKINSSTLNTFEELINKLRVQNMSTKFQLNT